MLALAVGSSDTLSSAAPPTVASTFGGVLARIPLNIDELESTNFTSLAGTSLNANLFCLALIADNTVA